jgi:hypothetical protein
MAKFKDPNPEWPVAVRKIVDGKLDTRYAHNDKELAKFTDDPVDGGLGYSTQPLTIEWPKLMSHPALPDVLVANEADEAKAAKRGYNYDHFDNARAQSVKREEQAAQPSFDPKAQVRIDLLEKQLEKQSKLIDQLLESQTKKKSV